MQLFFFTLRRKVHLHLIFTLNVVHHNPTESLRGSVDVRLLICCLHAVVRQVLRLSPQPSSNKSNSLTAAIVYFGLMNANVANSTGRNTSKNVASLQAQSFLLYLIHLLWKRGSFGLHSAQLRWGELERSLSPDFCNCGHMCFLRDFSSLCLKATSKSSLSSPLGKLFHI